MLKKLLLLFLVVVCLLLFGFIAAQRVFPEFAGAGLNTVASEEPQVISAQARALHSTLFIADLHAETLLWKRDLLERSTWGQLDLPRMREGNVAWQTFAVATRTPRGIFPERNEVGPDQVAIFALLGLWPVATWRDLTARAIYQSGLLQDAVARSSGRLMLVRSRADIESFLARRQADPQVTAATLGLVGGYAIGADLGNLDRLYDVGYRVVGLTASAEGDPDYSPNYTLEGRLTEDGHTLLRRLSEKGMILDLSYHPPELIDNLPASFNRPIIVSAAGVRELCQAARTLSDSRLKAIAASGGLIGIGCSHSVACGNGPTDIALSIRYAVNLVGAEHVALGSGFDSAVKTPFDASGLVKLTEALLRKGLTEDQIRKVMGENVLRFYRDNLP